MVIIGDCYTDLIKLQIEFYVQSDDDLIQRNCEIDNTQNPSTNNDGQN